MFSRIGGRKAGSGVGISEGRLESSPNLGKACTVSKRAWNCLALHCMSHFSVKSPLLGVIFSMLLKESSSEGHSGRGFGCQVGSFRCKLVS